MRFQWEVQDIVSGRYVDSADRKERFTIGYDPAIDEVEGNLLLTSNHDARVLVKGFTKSAMTDYLNDKSSRPVDIRMDDVAASD